jgi:hypothetical protein
VSESRYPSNRKRFLFPLGLLAGLIVLFSLFDLAGPPRRKVANTMTTREDPEPARPKLYREGETTIVIDNGFVHTSRFQYGGDAGKEEADALFACLEEGVEREFGPEDAPIDPFEGTDKRTHTRQRLNLTEEIKEQCLDQLAFQ